MSIARITVRFDFGDISAKLSNFKDRGQKVLDEEVLKDSNYYAPMDSGNLIQSGIRNTTFGSGVVVWQTVYTRRLYYNPQYNFSRDRNPNAGGLWFERAKSHNLAKWISQLDQVKRQTI